MITCERFSTGPYVEPATLVSLVMSSTVMSLLQLARGSATPEVHINTHCDRDKKEMKITTL